MLIIKKTVRFDAAHLLTGHAGQCKNMHGHTYQVDVELANSTPLPDQPQDMVMDFKELKNVLQKIICEPCDHAFIYDSKSEVELDIATVLQKHGLRTYPLPCRSTSENLARHFFESLCKNGLNVLAVTVSETPESHATYRLD